MNSKDEYGLTGLMKAIVRNKTATIHMLLRRCDIDINIGDSEGRCALHHAAWYDRGDIVTLLLADHRLSTVNMCCHDGGTPLLAAVDNNSIHSIKLLLEDSRISPNIQFEFPRCECPKCQMDIRTNPNQPGMTLTHGGSPLMWAVKRGLEECVKILLPHPRVNIMTTDSFRRSQTEVDR